MTAHRKKAGIPDESRRGEAEMEQRKGTDWREYETSITRRLCPADIASPSAASVSRQVSGPFLRGAKGEQTGWASGCGMRCLTRPLGAATSMACVPQCRWRAPVLLPAAAAALIQPGGGQRLTPRAHSRLTELPTTSSEL